MIYKWILFTFSCWTLMSLQVCLHKILLKFITEFQWKCKYAFYPLYFSIAFYVYIYFYVSKWGIRVRESLLSYRIFIEKFIHFLFKNSYWLTQIKEDLLILSREDQLTLKPYVDTLSILDRPKFIWLFKIFLDQIYRFIWNWKNLVILFLL